MKKQTTWKVHANGAVHTVKAHSKDHAIKRAHKKSKSVDHISVFSKNAKATNEGVSFSDLRNNLNTIKTKIDKRGNK
jgi:hypothetical protein